MNTIEIEPKLSEVRFEHTPNFAHVLEQLQVTLLVSTYQAGKLLAIGSHAGKLSIALSRFRPSAMNLVLAAKVLPVIYDSVEQVHSWRERLTDRVRTLVDRSRRNRRQQLISNPVHQCRWQEKRLPQLGQ